MVCSACTALYNPVIHFGEQRSCSTFPVCCHGHSCVVGSSIQSIALRLKEMCSLLPQPIHVPAVSDDESEVRRPALTQTIITRPVVLPYGQRRGWKPSSQDDFGVYPLAFLRRDSLDFQVMVVHFLNAMSLSTR